MIIENDQDITFLKADENTVSDFFIVFKVSSLTCFVYVGVLSYNIV